MPGLDSTYRQALQGGKVGRQGKDSGDLVSHGLPSLDGGGGSERR
jgi:hypothetical protein